MNDLREWLVSKIDGSEETRGEDSLISHFINQIDALPSEKGPIPASKTQVKRFAAQMEPQGCPTPGACSCPGTTPFEIRKKIMTAHMLAESIAERATVDTPITDAVVKIMEAGWLSLGSSAPGAVKPLVETMEQMERELIDIKQRLLPQFAGRAERAEKARQMAEHERDALLEQLMVAEKRVADQMTNGVATWTQAWKEQK